MYSLVIHKHLFYVSKDATYMLDLVYGSLFRLKIETIPRKRPNTKLSLDKMKGQDESTWTILSSRGNRAFAIDREA